MNEPGRSNRHLAHADEVREAVESVSLAASSALAASWRRSLHYYQLDPEKRTPPDRVNEAVLRQARERLGRLAKIAAPTLERLLRAVGRSGCSVLLTDSEGLVVERRGMAGDDQAFAEMGLWAGVNWSEGNEGTNGIGTCLVEQRPVVIHRDQHFYTRNTEMSCIGVPLFDAHARLAAVLDVSSCRGELSEDLTFLIATVVSDAAHRIEGDNFRAAFPSCRIVMAPAQGHQGSALLAVDSYDLVVGATRAARQTLRLTDDILAAGRPLPDVLTNSKQTSDLRAAERAELQRALARSDGNVSAAARDLGIGRATLYRRMKRLGLAEGPAATRVGTEPGAGVPLQLSHN